MKLFSNSSETARIMAAATVVINLIILATGAVIAAFVYSFGTVMLYAAGVVLGGVHSLVKIILLEKSLNSVLDKEKEGAANTARLFFLVRYLMTGAVFVIAALVLKVPGLVGTILGVLSLQPAAIAANVILNKRERQQADREIAAAKAEGAEDIEE